MQKQAICPLWSGTLPRPHAAYDQALQVLARLRAQLTEQESLVKRWEIVHGQGCAEHNSDANEACATSHAEALRITRQLSDGARTALTLVNLADAYWGCHRYGLPLRLYQEAIEASMQACYHDALDVAQIGRGIVLWSIGRYDQADASLRAGVTLAKELDYAWDVAYGMLYQSNLEASKGKLMQAVRTNRAALERAQALGASYLIALATVYLSWKDEVISPGALANKDRLHYCLDLCARNDLRGVAVVRFVEPIAKVSNGTPRHHWAGRNPWAQCSSQVGTGLCPCQASKHGAHLSCGIQSERGRHGSEFEKRDQAGQVLGRIGGF